MHNVSSITKILVNGRTRPLYDIIGQEEFEDTKGVIRIYKSKDRQYNGEKEQKDKQRSIKYYTEN